jgi:hypothetical protein
MPHITAPSPIRYRDATARAVPVGAAGTRGQTASVLTAVTARAANRMMVTVDGHPACTVDPLQARALGMLLAEASCVGLDPTGPHLTVTKHPLLSTVD